MWDRIKVKVNGLKQSSSISLLLYSSFLDSTRLANYSCFLARTHITYLHLKCFPRTALELLKDCPSVIEAHFVLPPHGFPGTEPPTLTRTSPGHSIIPLLLTLTLEVINASLPGYDFPFPALAHFLNSFTAPSLISLFFLSDANQNPHSIYPPPNTEFLSALSNLIYRSSAQITRARIEGIPITTYELVPVLKALYRVRELTLGEAKGKRNKLVTTSLLALLAGRALPYSALVPDLKVLKLEVRDDRWERNTFEEMVKVRFQRGLHSVLVGIDRTESTLDMERLRGLQRDGLAVRIIHGNRPIGNRVALGYCWE
ncbi:hypothetical protein Moror_11165 [Moniliophthora roreri MCA 2997]|uniref:F-box domain-containing protein n=1 Tax=Moniliophthora roreri (strain MCA 2997) TaxID=1381753 RepID=V2W7A7_MONRO|nr:hypothetical protein Moror_11165 [Moniliophthora roreri MCA 2997]